MHSCLYYGRVAHSRLRPLTHSFEYGVFMAYIDLDEWAAGLPPISRSPYARVSWPEGKHLRDRKSPLRQSVADLVESQTGIRPRGPIRLLTQLQYLGLYFSPLNLFYCFCPDGRTLEAIVAEVNNTPWSEQHHYVLWEGNRLDAFAGLQFRHPKDFHVSPFMGMDMDYRWALATPSETLEVRIENVVDEEVVFHAGMQMTRRPLDQRNLSRMLWRYPWMTGAIVAAIYWQALKLWWKKCPYHPHPKTIAAPERV